MSGLQSFQGNKSAISTEHRNMCWTCGAQVNKQKESSSLDQRKHKIWLTFKLRTDFSPPQDFYITLTDYIKGPGTGPYTVCQVLYIRLWKNITSNVKILH